MITRKTETHPEINWQRGQWLDAFDHTVLYVAYGQSDDGRKFTATMAICCGETEIQDIEEE